MCQVGLTKDIWSPNEYIEWEMLAKEAQEHGDVLIRPDLDNRSERIF